MPADYLVKCKACGKPLGFAYAHEPGVNDALCGAKTCADKTTNPTAQEKR